MQVGPIGICVVDDVFVGELGGDTQLDLPKVSADEDFAVRGQYQVLEPLTWNILQIRFQAREATSCGTGDYEAWE
jgi:hypothetical protein